MMVWRSAAWRCFGTLSGLIKLNQACINGDETWITITTRELSSWALSGCLWHHQICWNKTKSEINIILITFFDAKGIIHWESVSLQRGPAPNASRNKAKSWGRTPRQCPFSQRTELRWTSPYWNNLSIEMNSFFLFIKLKGIIKRTCFYRLEAIKKTVTIDLKGMPN